MVPILFAVFEKNNWESSPTLAKNCVKKLMTWFNDQVQSDGPDETWCKQDWSNNTLQSHLTPIESKHIRLPTPIYFIL